MKLPEYQNLLIGTSHGELFKLSIYSNNTFKINNICNPISISNSLYIMFNEGSDFFFSSGEMCNGYLFSVIINYINFINIQLIFKYKLINEIYIIIIYIYLD